MKLSLVLLTLGASALVHGSAIENYNQAKRGFVADSEEEALVRDHANPLLEARQNPNNQTASAGPSASPSFSQSSFVGISSSSAIVSASETPSASPSASSSSSKKSSKTTSKTTKKSATPSPSESVSSGEASSSTGPITSHDSSAQASKTSSPSRSKATGGSSSDADGTTVVVRTVTRDGHKSMVSSTVSAKAQSTSSSRASASASLSTDTSDDSSSGGLSPQNKKIVIGVCVGVGGALLLLGLGFVAWRIWFRKGGSSGSPYVGGSPAKDHSFDDGGNVFRQNIDQYHNSGHVNNAANF